MSNVDPMQSSIRVLVLGATGNIGSRVAGVLAESGANVMPRLASSRSSGCDSLRERFPGVEVVRADWYDSHSLVSASVGVDRVFVVTPDFRTIAAFRRDDGVGFRAVATSGTVAGPKAIRIPADTTAARTCVDPNRTVHRMLEADTVR